MLPELGGNLVSRARDCPSGTWLKTHLYKALQKLAASSALQLNVYHFSTQLRLIADNCTKNTVICNTLYEI